MPLRVRRKKNPRFPGPPIKTPLLPLQLFFPHAPSSTGCRPSSQLGTATTISWVSLLTTQENSLALLPQRPRGGVARGPGNSCCRPGGELVVAAPVGPGSIGGWRTALLRAWGGLFWVGSLGWAPFAVRTLARSGPPVKVNTPLLTYLNSIANRAGPQVKADWGPNCSLAS